MHNVVNTSHLQPYQANSNLCRVKLSNPHDNLKATEEYEVEQIVGHCNDHPPWAQI